MTTAAMTDKQRRALGAREAARQQGCSLTEYAKAQGLEVRELYNVLAALRRKGVLGKSTRRSGSKFVSVAPAAPTMIAATRTPGASGVLCRIVPVTGCPIECMHWPPPSWVAALNSGVGSTDAAA